MQDREEIRRRLAMENDDEIINRSPWKSSASSSSSTTSIGHKKVYLNKLITNTSDLRMCFFNKTPDHYEVNQLANLKVDYLILMIFIVIKL